MPIKPWNEPVNDGKSRPFDDTSTDPQQVVAQVLAGRDGWPEICPRHWRDADAVVKTLRAKGQLVDRRARRRAAP